MKTQQKQPLRRALSSPAPAQRERPRAPTVPCDGLPAPSPRRPLNKMAAPQRPGAPLLWRGVGSSRARAQSTLLQPEKHRSCWSFPMGQKPRGTFTRAPSYLLQQLIRHSQESDADGEEEEEDQGEAQGEGESQESEESSESEMPRLEVCSPLPTSASPRTAEPTAPASLESPLPFARATWALTRLKSLPPVLFTHAPDFC